MPRYKSERKSCYYRSRSEPCGSLLLLCPNCFLCVVWNAPLRRSQDVIHDPARLASAGVVAGTERTVAVAVHQAVRVCRLYVTIEDRTGGHVGETGRVGAVDVVAG